MAHSRSNDRRPTPTEASSLHDNAALVGRIATAPLWLRAAACLLLLGLITVLDDLTGAELSFSVFYLLPVLFGGVFISRGTGRFFALAGAVVWGVLEVLSREYSVAWIPVWNTAVRLTFFMVINELVNATREAHVRERKQARRDSLTGAVNGRVFAERLAQEIARSRRDARPFTVAYADLDRFKQVNDTLGHTEGDRLLRLVAETLRREVRAVDVVARLGGDEFGLLLTETDVEGARGTLARIAEAVRHETGERWGVGATFGAITFVQPPTDVDSAVTAADNLMYRGKAQERGTVLHRVWPSDFDETDESQECA